MIFNYLLALCDKYIDILIDIFKIRRKSYKILICIRICRASYFLIRSCISFTYMYKYILIK